MSSQDNWRKDPNMVSKTFYKKKFALFPKKCEDSETVWLKNYYKKYERWGHGFGEDTGHTDHVENITEAEYIVRRLKEGF
jgi:hypothetical protein